MIRGQDLNKNIKLTEGKISVRGLIPSSAIGSIRKAAADSGTIRGLTHGFYRYPARFSPTFVASAIEAFSIPEQVVLDPYMGGGTTMVEAYAHGRVAVGCDLNSLAVFISRAKVSRLSELDRELVRRWSIEVVPTLFYHTVTDEVADLICPYRTRNLSLPRARPVKKLLALGMLSIRILQTDASKNFARAVLLNVAQWALNNRKMTPSLERIRTKITSSCSEMVSRLNELAALVDSNGLSIPSPVLIHGTATDLPAQSPFVNGLKANLVVTSPPYPGIHILYHRWQVDGRKETPAPYWITECYDGKGASYYNFADRKQAYEDAYFAESLTTLRSIRQVMVDGAIMVQMIAFSEPRRQLPKYLENMRSAGFTEIRETLSEDRVQAFRRIWRAVPSRAWYANLKGETNSSREVVLLHCAS